MPNYSIAILTGHLGKDPELRKTQNMKDVATFTLAVKTGYGEYQKTTWWNCRAFGKNAEAAEKFLKKGSAVTVQGEPFVEEWEKKDGTKSKAICLSVDRIILIDSNKTDKPLLDSPKKINDYEPFDEQIPF